MADAPAKQMVVNREEQAKFNLTKTLSDVHNSNKRQQLEDIEALTINKQQ